MTPTTGTPALDTSSANQQMRQPHQLLTEWFSSPQSYPMIEWLVKSMDPVCFAEELTIALQNAEKTLGDFSELVERYSFSPDTKGKLQTAISILRTKEMVNEKIAQVEQRVTALEKKVSEPQGNEAASLESKREVQALTNGGAKDDRLKIALAGISVGVVGCVCIGVGVALLREAFKSAGKAPTSP